MNNEFLSMMLAAATEELAKLAGASTGAVSPPSPGGDGSTMTSKPGKPTTSKALVGKSVSKSQLVKTDYAKPNTKAVTADVPMTAGQQAVGFQMVAPPPVTSVR